MGSVEKLAASPQNANVGFRVKHTLTDLHPHKYPLTYLAQTHNINLHSYPYTQRFVYEQTTATHTMTASFIDL